MDEIAPTQCCVDWAIEGFGMRIKSIKGHDSDGPPFLLDRPLAEYLYTNLADGSGCLLGFLALRGHSIYLLLDVVFVYFLSRAYFEFGNGPL